MGKYLVFVTLALFQILFTALIVAHPHSIESAEMRKLELASLTSVQARSQAKSPISLPLTRKKTKSISHSLLRRMSSGGTYGSLSNSTQIISAEDGQIFIAPIAFGEQPFLAVVDTGSSDTWLVHAKFECISGTTGMREGEAECAFGSPYVETPTFTKIPDQNLNVSYGDGELLTGSMGLEEVGVAGITVLKQEVGVVDYAAWTGDGESSGILGLAYPGLTSAWEGSEQDSSEDSVQEEYEPIFMSMISQGLIQEPVFSLAIDRGNGSGGVLTFGGLPDQTTVSYANKFAKAPIEVLGEPGLGGNAALDSEYTFYAITIDGFPNPNASASHGSGSYRSSHSRWPNISKIQAIVDSGTTLVYLPNSVSTAINRLFGTQAHYDPITEIWFVDCNATAPSWDLTIGGQIFSVNPADMIVEDIQGDCVSGVQDAFIEFAILGDVFLKNVLAVFDVGNVEMRFATRE